MSLQDIVEYYTASIYSIFKLVEAAVMLKISVA